MISIFSMSSKTMRIVAVATILVSGLGKVFHQHQECGCCSSQAAATPETVVCPYGCDDCSWAEQQNAKQDGDQQRRPPKHDERHCSVCQVLAQAPQVPEIVQAPPSTARVQFLARVCSERPADTRPLIVCSRGPPAAGFPAV